MQQNAEVQFSEIIPIVIEKALNNIETYSMSTSLTKTHFDSVRVPNISIKDYFGRIRHYVNCSDSCYVVAFIYIDRILINHPSLLLTKKNVHRVILTAIILSIKYLEDLYADNKFYAMVGGINVNEFNLLESDMLVLINFDLYIDPELYYQYMFNQIGRASCRERVYGLV